MIISDGGSEALGIMDIHIHVSGIVKYSSTLVVAFYERVCVEYLYLRRAVCKQETVELVCCRIYETCYGR